MKKRITTIIITSAVWTFHVLTATCQSLTPAKSAVVSSTLRIAAATTADASDVNKAAVSVQYVDGLGRSIQQVGYGQTPDKKDLVRQTTVYDVYGRGVKQFLPSPTDNLSGGWVSPATVQAKGAAAYGATTQPDNTPFIETTVWDNSPLNRPRKSFGAGQAWRTADKAVFMYDEVAAANEVRRYVFDATGVVKSSVAYPANSLVKSRRVDEQGHTTISYTDRRGLMVQQQQQDDNDYITTCYVYDRLDRLRAVIQPEGYLLDASIPFTDPNFGNYVFAYDYDAQNRLVRKHVPGGGWTKYVYDKAYRPVLEQSALQAQSNKWSFIKYDLFGRVIMTGELVSSSTQNSLQTAFEAVVNPYEIWDGTSKTYSTNSFPTGFTNVVEQTINYYDQYDFVANNLPVFQSGAYHTQYVDAKGLPTGSSVLNGANPPQRLYSVMYYDNKGRVIQTHQTHLKGGNVPLDNPLRVDYEYNFAGEVLKEKVVQKTTGLPVTTTLTVNEYDHTGRLLKVYHSINGVASQELCRYGYDGIGRVAQKKVLPTGTYQYSGVLDYITRSQSPVGPTGDVAKKAITIQPNTLLVPSYSATITPNASGGSPISGLQTIDYSHHIRGGLRGVNLDASGNAVPNASQGDLFSFKLDYETAGQWDGNIGKQSWKNDTESQRSYSYTYDPAKRLKTAGYNGLTGENYSLPLLAYDRNGNISKLKRNGKKGASFGTIDSLTYVYSGNRLTSVTDAVSGNYSVDLVPRGGGGYTYYADGSLKSDANEQIQNIVYDTFLKQPIEVVLTDNRKIRNYYDGGGRLIKTIYYTATNTVLETWEYVGAFVFKNNQFYQMATPDGRATYNGSTWNYEFFYQDHLGNTRVSFKAESGQLVKTAETAFDPWGVRLNGIGNANGFQNRWEMQNHEKEATCGLNRISFGARTYNPTIGKFDRIDAMSEKFNTHSPFNYVLNNPILKVDLDGNEPLDDFLLRRDGSIEFLKSTPNTNTDRLIVENDRSKSIEVTKGTFSKKVERNSTPTSSNSRFEAFVIKGEGDAKKVFEFAAQNSDVEFAQINMTSKGGVDLSIVRTEHSVRSVKGSVVAEKFDKAGYKIRDIFHSHPYESFSLPSGGFKPNNKIDYRIQTGDRINAKRFPMSKGSEINYRVYSPGSNTYLKYDGDKTY